MGFFRVTRDFPTQGGWHFYSQRCLVCFIFFLKKVSEKKREKKVNIHESGHIGPCVLGWPFFIMGLALGVLL
jgi:hypothetical protein